MGWLSKTQEGESTKTGIVVGTALVTGMSLLAGFSGIGLHDLVKPENLAVLSMAGAGIGGIVGYLKESLNQMVNPGKEIQRENTGMRLS